MFRTTCGECQSNLVSYLHQQLSPRKRRRVALHLQSCGACYARYVTERDLAQALRQGVSPIGQANVLQLARVWSAIQRDMTRPEPIRRINWSRYAVVCAVLALALLLPSSLEHQQIALAVPPQPSAPALVALATPAIRASGTAAVTSTDTVIPPAETPSAVARTPRGDNKD